MDEAPLSKEIYFIPWLRQEDLNGCAKMWELAIYGRPPSVPLPPEGCIITFTPPPVCPLPPVKSIMEILNGNQIQNGNFEGQYNPEWDFRGAVKNRMRIVKGSQI